MGRTNSATLSEVEGSRPIARSSSLSWVNSRDGQFSSTAQTKFGKFIHCLYQLFSVIPSEYNERLRIYAGTEFCVQIRDDFHCPYRKQGWTTTARLNFRHKAECRKQGWTSKARPNFQIKFYQRIFFIGIQCRPAIVLLSWIHAEVKLLSTTLGQMSHEIEAQAESCFECSFEVAILDVSTTPSPCALSKKAVSNR